MPTAVATASVVAAAVIIAAAVAAAVVAAAVVVGSVDRRVGRTIFGLGLDSDHGLASDQVHLDLDLGRRAVELHLDLVAVRFLGDGVTRCRADRGEAKPLCIPGNVDGPADGRDRARADSDRGR